MRNPALWFREGFAGPRIASRPSSRPLLAPGLEEAEEEEVVVVGPVVVVVVYGGDAPDDLAVTLGQVQVHPRVLEEGVLRGVELLPLGDQQRREPVRGAAG